jgi:zinc protease
VTRVTSVEGITEYRLENGLRILLLPDVSKQTTTVNITYIVGSRHENYGETGMAHLLEHLMFKGTPRHPNIAKELTDHGARPNGTTWLDRTNYFETFAANDANLEWALDLEADRMVNSFIARKDLDSEMTVVRNEFESGENNPANILGQRTVSTAFLWHNYGKSTIGARSDLENVPIDRLQAFWRKYYQPDNAVLMVAGNYDPAKTLALIAKKFGPIPRPTRVLTPTYTAEPTQDGERTVTLRRVGDVGALSVVYHVPSAAHPDSQALDVLAQMMSDSPSGRLYKALVRTKVASDVSGYQFSLKEPGILQFDATIPRPADLDSARATLLKTIDALAGEAPPTEEEVARAKAQIVKQIDLSLSSSENVGLSVSEYIAMGDWRLIFLSRDRVKAVTADDVRQVAKAYLKPDNRTVGTFIPTPKPDRAEIPAAPDIAVAMKDYKGSEAVAAGEPFDPSPSGIEKRTRRLTEAGVKTAFVSKKTRGETVNAVLTLHIGDEKSLFGKSTIGSLAGGMLMRGTAKHTRQQLRDEFDRLKANVGVGGGARSVSASIQTTRANLPAVLRLVAEILREPAFPEAEFEEMRTQRIAGIKERMSDPGQIAGNAQSRYLSPYPKGDVRYSPTPQEQIEELEAATLADVKAFHRDFYGASSAELAIVGDFDEGEVAPLVRNLFGGWKNKQPYARVPNPYRALPGENRSFETPDKANAVTYATLLLPVRDDDPDYPALNLGGYILGGGFLNSRLASRIRQKEGISYGIGGGINADAFDKRGTLSLYGIYAPQNAGRFEAAAREEITRLLKEGVTEDEVTAAKQALLQARAVSRAQDGELAGLISARTFQGRTLAFDEAYDAKLNALNAAAVNAALRRHVKLEQLGYFKAGDFANAQKTGSANK